MPAAMIGMKGCAGKWKKPGAWNMEQHVSDPFMDDMHTIGKG